MRKKYKSVQHHNDIEYNGVFYSPATEEAYIANGYKRIVRSVPQYPPQEKYKWVKHPEQDETTIYYSWVEEQMTDAEYLMYCHEQLTDTNKKMINYYEGEYPEEKYLYWKAKRKEWRDFIRAHEEGEQ